MRLETTRLTLELADASMLLDEVNGLIVTELDLGFPTIREVTDDTPARDGTDDATELFGARVVSIKATLTPADEETRLDVLRRLSRFCVPKCRPTLIVDEDGREPRRLRLRTSAWSSPLAGTATTDVGVSWNAPSGVLEAVTETSVTMAPFVTGEAPGRSWPISFPLSWPASTGGTAAQAIASGTVAAPWTAIVHGPCADPALKLTDDSFLFKIDDLTLSAGQFLLIDSTTRTVLLDGTASRRSNLDFVASSWAALQPGTTELMFTPASSSAPSDCVITWHDTWIH